MIQLINKSFQQPIAANLISSSNFIAQVMHLGQTKYMFGSGNPTDSTKTRWPKSLTLKPSTQSGPSWASCQSIILICNPTWQILSALRCTLSVSLNAWGNVCTNYKLINTPWKFAKSSINEWIFWKNDEKIHYMDEWGTEQGGFVISFLLQYPKSLQRN